MKKIKVAVVIPTHHNIKSSLQNLIKVYLCLMRKYGLDVTIFTDKKNDFSYDGLKVKKISGVDHRTLLEKVLLVLGLQRNFYVDIIQKLEGYDVIETSNPEFYWFAYQAYIAAKKYNSRLILRTSQTVDGFYLFKLTKFIPLSIARKAYKFARYLMFANPQAAERCVRLGLVESNSRKIVVIGHPTDIRCFKPLKIKKPKFPVVLSVGGLYKIKGHHIIIEAFKKVRERFGDAQLWIVGDGYYRKKLEHIAKDFGLDGSVKFLGSLGHKQLAEVYNKASVFALANYQEITPAVNEAISCEIPVVVMECGGFEFVLPNEDYGVMSRRFDAEDMADKISLLLENKAYAAKSAKNRRKRIIENFSIEKVAEKFYRCFTG